MFKMAVAANFDFSKDPPFHAGSNTYVQSSFQIMNERSKRNKHDYFQTNFFYIKWLWLASIIELVNLPLTNIQVDKFYSKKEKLKVDQGRKKIENKASNDKLSTIATNFKQKHKVH